MENYHYKELWNVRAGKASGIIQMHQPLLQDILLGALSSFQVDRLSSHYGGLIVGVYKMLMYLEQQAITYFNGNIMVYITQNTLFVTLHEKKYESL